MYYLSIKACKKQTLTKQKQFMKKKILKKFVENKK